ncbi:MAG: DUF1232 domain-containing protein [Desulfobacteraceae bacterium]|jgi:uncharacterized membrane protein YkvA (DUF1232 family)|nr:MAG: DUF1232 domain-containing protein [Desulfobacteraceae bacterium]
MLFKNFKEAVLNRLTREEKQKALEMAENMADDFDADRAAQFVKKHADKSWFNDFKLLYDLITDRTFKLKPSTWAVIAGAIAYVVMPIDVIPDFILGLGWIDDAFVLATTTTKISEEISRYKMHLKA